MAPELEALILRMLAESPEARGTAGELAEAVERAERSAGPVADVQVRPSRSMLPTERATRPGPTRWHLASQALRRHSKRLTVAGTLAASIVTGGLLPLLGGPRIDERSAPVAAAEEEQREEAGAEQRVVGLGDGGVDEMLVAAEAQPSYGAPGVRGRSLPEKPASGQRRPPCEPERQKAINGLCWWVHPWKPPCGDDYEHEGRCYAPVVLKARPPTTEEP